MLIHLHESVRELLETPLTEATVAAFENLAACRWEGKHHLFGPKQLFADLSRHQDLSKRAQNVFKRLLNRSATQGGLLLTLFPHRVEVHKTAKPHDPIVNGKRHIYRFPLAHFSSSDHCNATVILGENEVDARFYLCLGKISACRQKAKSPLRCILQGGGGDTTRTAFERGQRNGHPILCFADGDQTHPKGAIGKTAAKIKKTWDQETLSHVHVLGVRDAENLIPLGIMADIILDNPHSDQESKQAAAYYKQIDKSQDYMDFVDIKAGMRPNTLPKNQFWQSHKNDLYSKAYKLQSACKRNRVCASPETCGCVFIPGLGDKILMNTVSFLEGKASSKQSEVFGKDFHGELEIIGNLVKDWCCAPKRIGR